MTERFADTFYYLALVNRADAAHARARTISRQTSARTTTTEWVLTEVGDALCGPKQRHIFVQLMRRLQSTPEVTIVPASHELFAKGLELYKNRRDQWDPLESTCRHASLSIL